MKNFVFIICLTILSVSFARISCAEGVISGPFHKAIYFGTEFGIAEPVAKHFKDNNSGARIGVKRSNMYSGKVGYNFYPGMMIEISATHQPKYKMTYKLPETSIFPNLTIPETLGNVNVSSKVLTMNLIYQMEKFSFLEVKPYVIFGAGLAKVSIKSAMSYWAPPGLKPIGFFKIKKTSQNCFAWQAGGGVIKSIAPNFFVDFAAKLQVVNNIKMKYQTLNMLNNLFEKAKSIKKTIGVGEFTVGFTYSIPLSSSKL